MSENLVALAVTLGRAFLWLPIAAIALAWKKGSRARRGRAGLASF